MSRAPKPALVDAAMVHRRLHVSARDAVIVKALVESYEGVACVFGEEGGDLTIAAPCDRERELDGLMHAIGELLARAHG
jgi:hypothetical protein